MNQLIDIFFQKFHHKIRVLVILSMLSTHEINLAIVELHDFRVIWNF